MRNKLIERLRRGPVWGDGSPIGSVVGEINGATMNEAADALAAYDTDDRIKELEQVIAVAAEAIDIADSIIAINCGIDTPKEWGRAFRKVAKARTALKGDA